MTDLLTGVAWTDIGAGGVVILAVLMILTGQIVPRRVYKDMEAQRDVWQQAYREQQATIADFGARIDAQGEGVRTVERLLQSLLSRERIR